MTDLRAELERIAERAPSVDVSPDLYARARRANTRTRVLAVAAAAACLALLVGLVAIGPWHADAGPQPAGGYSPAAVVPDRIYVPTEESDLPLVSMPAAEKWATPIVAAYTMAAPTEAVLIHGDGSYARVTLPGVSNRTAAGSAFALSPNGESLAYYRYDGRAQQTYLVIAQTTGGWGSSDIRVGGRIGALVSSVRWSPDSQQLLWTGKAVVAWHDGRPS